MRMRNQKSLGFVTDEARQVFERWKETMGSPRSKLDPRRAEAIDGMLAVGYSIEDLELAIFGCSISPFHQGQNDRREKYYDIGLICRDAEHVDKFIAMAEKAMAKRVQRIADKPQGERRPVPEHLRRFMKA